jgi:NitT/TauT family transport system substrate-binding protein
MERSHRFIMIVGIACLLFPSACNRAPNTEVEPQPEKVKVLLLPFLSFAPFFIADQEGYFSEQGLEVEFVRLDRGTEAIAAFAQDDLDVYAGAINVGILKAMRNSNIKIVADKGYFDPEGCTYMTFLARQNEIVSGELDEVSGIRSKRVDMSVPGNIREYYLDSMLASAGLSQRDIELVVVPDEAAGEALFNGSFDLVPITEPWVTRILQAGGSAIWMPAQKVLPGYHFSFIAYSARFLRESPQVGKRFMLAYIKAIERYSQGKIERNLEIMVNATGLERQVLLDSCWSPIAKDGKIEVDDILEFQDWAQEKGYLDPPLLAEDQIWDPSFVDYALQNQR